MIFVEEDESAVNKKDKYAKQAAADQQQRAQEQQQQQQQQHHQQQCDNNNEAKSEETCTTCDSTNLESSPNVNEEKIDKLSDQEATTSEETASQEQHQSQSQPESLVQENTTPEIMSSVLATMWMGDDCGNIYVHSSVDNWAQCLHTVKLKDAVIAIV